MAVRKDPKSGKWLAEAYVKGKRIRKQFDNKGEANRFYTALKQENSPVFKAIQVQKEQPQRLSELVQLWYDLHGQTLVRGESYKAKLLLMCDAFGDPYARDFTVEHFAEYRKKRLSGEIVFKNSKNATTAKASTINFEHAILKGMFNELKRFKKWSGDNPVADLKAFREKENELYFLRVDEIKLLLEACEVSKCADLKIAVELCLSTGARWGEIKNLTASNVIPYKVTFTKTKGGKNRTVPITPELYQQINQQIKLKSGKLFSVTDIAFRNAIAKAGIVLPRNQLTHVLRHTFASHFMMNGGNILVLKDILGHYSITMTMIYAHFSPSHLETATKLNPITNLNNPVAI